MNAGNLTYRFRLGLFSKEISYHLEEYSLRSDGGVVDEILFSDIRRIRIYQSPGAKWTPEFRRCIITTKIGKDCILSSNHFVYFGFESRMSSYQPFIDELFRRVKLKNPGVEYYSGFSPVAQWIYTFVCLGLAAVYCLSFIAMVLILPDLVGQEFWQAMFAFLMVLFFGGISLFQLWRTMRRNRFRRFDPRIESPLS